MEEEEKEEGSSRGLCTLNTQTDVLLLTRASAMVLSFFYHQHLSQGSLTPLTRCRGSPSPRSQSGGGGGETKPHKR